MLLPSEKNAIAWQRKVLPIEIRNLGEALHQARLGLADEIALGRILCRLKQQQKVGAIFLWAREFLPWLANNYGLDVRRRNRHTKLFC